jgi:hypothetical protein
MAASQIVHPTLKRISIEIIIAAPPKMGQETPE